MAEAEFSGTTLYAGRRRHPRHGAIEVLGYENTALNLADGPNAMLLHLPARAMAPEQFVPVGRRGGRVLAAMVDAVRPLSRSEGAFTMDWMSAEPQSVQVFEHDVYTVLLAADPTLIPAALGRVPHHRRPRLDPALMEFYADHYPLHSIAVCCFDNADARRAKPLLVWYEPLDPDVLAAPALDAHTGGPPDPDAPVGTDHWVIFGSDEAPDGWGAPVRYGRGLRDKVRAFLPETVMGAHFTSTMPNGDFAIAHDDLLAGRLDRIERLRPSVR
ncbi:hypothetical protein [Actinomadura sp. WMMB 499]|uniref:hypothetical protein n=1 Tax=Actinomadura sp. WMMB 499 TaxID=1219491 RepID=UPI0020C7F4BA|nr:hypothetical protein [Actinomadura sp. WMMB 499]